MSKDSVVEKVKALLSDADQDTLMEVKHHIDRQLPADSTRPGERDPSNGTVINDPPEDFDAKAAAEEQDRQNAEAISAIGDGPDTSDK